MHSDSFHRISRSLRRDRGIPSTFAAAVACLLSATWLIWSFRAHVTRYEVSQSARLEVSASDYPIQANAAGRLAKSNVSLGRNVQAGEVLAEIDSSIERSSLNEQRTALASLTPEISA